MKRWIVYPGLLAALLLLPEGQGVDIGQLKPAEILYIYIEDGATVVQTDTDNVGKAWNLEGAIADMRQTSDGEVFLDTVSYLVVTEETKDKLPELGKILRPGTSVVMATAPVELKNLAAFLKVHKPKIQLFSCVLGQANLPKLMTAGEQWYLVQQSDG